MSSQRVKSSFITVLVITSLLLINSPVAAMFSAAPGLVSRGANSAQQSLAPTATATVGTGGTYLTLKAAFDDINTGVLTGTIQLDVIGDTTETATAVLNASGVLTASYTSVVIQPSGGSWIISGTMTAGSPLIDLNGADNVTINGLNSGGNALTIVNSTASATSGTSTIRFIGGATNNTVTNATILGAFSASVATNGGNIYFATDGSTANGNDNNTISNNNIGPVSAAALPTKGIYGNGSTTTAAIGNNGIVISNNNVYDYFGAAVASAGIYVASGNSGWTITNNRFYQTAPRTWTTGANNRAIDIQNSSTTTGAQGFTITGNTIGFSSSAGVGTYTLSGSTGKFAGIVFNGVLAGAVSTILTNTIASVSLTGVTSSGTNTSSPFMAILVTNGAANTSGNTIGSQSITSSLIFSTTTTTATDVFGIYNFSFDNWVANNNSIGGLTANNSGATGAFIVYLMRANTSTTNAFTADSNVLGGTVADSIQNNSTSTTAQAYGLYTTNAAATFTNNTLRNFTAAGGTGTTTSASVIGIGVNTTSVNHTVRQNTIHSLSNTNGSAATTVNGIQFTGSTSNLVARNLIHSFNTASPAGIVNGINVSGGTTTYQNNMIRLGIDAAGNSVTTGAAFNGINEPLGTDNFYFNSVYVGGTGVVSTTSNSYAFNSQQTVNTRTFRNNVFVNARSNDTGGGKHYAIRVGGTTPNPTGLTSNNNVITATGAGAVFGFFNSADVADLAAWRTATGQDANSFALDPQFIAPAAATPDLHISPVITTVVEGNGFPIAAVTDDFDGDVRANFTPTDIGADAGNFIGIDLAGPAITYIPFGNTGLTSDRVLAAAIVDVTGVPTFGLLQPRLYFNKNGSAWSSTQGILTSGTGLSGTWNFTVTVGSIGGVTAGDVISYFVIAEDTASPANLTSNPAGAVASDVNNVTTAPTPNTYTIIPAFSGSYNVGVTEVYTSLTNAGGLFQAVNAGALTGNVIINITSDLTGESGTVALNQWAEDGAGGYTLLIRPSGGAVTVTGSINGALIRLFGTDRVTVDGSVSGGTDRSLTIQNTNIGTSAAVIAVQSAANGAQNNTIKNVNILGQDPTTTLVGLSLGGNTPGTTGTDNDNNRVENNAVRRAIFGIYAAGQNAANPNLGTVIIGNDLTGTGTDRVRRVGILVLNEDGVQITQNSIGGIDSNEINDAIGIGVGIQSVDASTTTSGGVINAQVTRNRITGVNQSNTFSAAGIAVAGGAGGNNTIVNNMVAGVTANATSPDVPVGIFVAGVTGSNTRLYFNSVSMTGDRGATGSQTPDYGLAVTGADPTVTAQDNILYTTQTASGGGVNAKSYAIGLASSTFTNLDSNYNLFYAAGANAGYFRTGSLGAGAGTDYATLGAWQTAVSDDANSLFGDALFTSDTNLHLQSTSPAVNAGTSVTGITTDIDGELRSVTTPSIGADEGSPFVPAIGLVKTVGINPESCAVTSAITVTEGTQVTYCYTVNNTGNITLTMHALTDTVLGPVLNNYAYTLAPGASLSITASQTILTNTTNAAYWTASNGVYTATANAIATVNTVPPVAPNPAIALVKTVGTNPIVCAATTAITVTEGMQVTYCYTVNNTGNITLTTHTLTDTVLGSLLNNFTYSLAPGASLSITTSQAILTDTLNVAYWTAGDGSHTALANASAQVHVTAQPPRLVYLPLIRK